MAVISMPFGAFASRRAPTPAELSAGFPCGELDQELFNWLHWRQTALTSWWPVISVNTTVPSPSPQPGDMYVIPTNATGDWSGHAQKIAEWTGNEWAITTPPNGHGVSLPDGRIFERVDGVYIEKIALDVQSGRWLYAVAGGTANALTVALTPKPGALAAGMSLRIKISTANTGAVTLNVNGLGAKPVLRKDGAALATDSIVAGQLLDVVYDGTAWQALDVVGGSGAFAIGKIVQITESGTYTPTPGCRALMVECIGGGGAGGGAAAVTSNADLTSGAGGGSGAMARKLIISPLPSYIATIGAGGIGVAAGNGGNGGTTSFGSVVSCTGGAGGTTGLIAGAISSVAGGIGGTATGGDINSDGTRGTRGGRSPVAQGGYGGEGAPSYLGGGGASSGSAYLPGSNAVGFGAGGGGAVINGTGFPALKGGAGASGIIIITEYF